MASKGKFFINLIATAKSPTGEGGLQITLPDGTKMFVGGVIDSTGTPRTLEGYELPTCEKSDSGTLENFTRIFFCSERFKSEGQ
ncbi:MAG: hypothetical protein WCH99_12840 [Verrucomicrobiota bacterium]